MALSGKVSFITVQNLPHQEDLTSRTLDILEAVIAGIRGLRDCARFDGCPGSSARFVTRPESDKRVT